MHSETAHQNTMIERRPLEVPPTAVSKHTSWDSRVTSRVPCTGLETSRIGMEMFFRDVKGQQMVMREVIAV